eukprot:PhF_6_TR42114/c0_g1_i1/m.63596
MMRPSFTLLRRRNHQNYYPQLPWMMNDREPNFMDHAQYEYGRRETWGKYYRSDSPRKVDALAMMLEYIRCLDDDYNYYWKEAMHHEYHLAKYQVVYEMWVSKALKEGPHTLHNWIHPAMPPDTTVIPRWLDRAIAKRPHLFCVTKDKQQHDTTTVPLNISSGSNHANTNAPLPQQPQAVNNNNNDDDDTPIRVVSPFEEDTQAGNLKYDPTLSVEVASELPNDVSELPFVRMRAEENPGTLHPSVLRWTKKWYPEPLTQKPLQDHPTPSSDSKPEEGHTSHNVSQSTAAVKTAVNRSQHKEETSPYSTVSPTNRPFQLLKQKDTPTTAPPPPRVPAIMPKNLKQLKKRKASFDSQNIFRSTNAGPVAIDWETAKMANLKFGYDGKRAIERKIRLLRGEDV